MNNGIVESSFKYCENIARTHYENFPVASRLIPEDKRKYIYSIYAFARRADDFADEEKIGSNEERLKYIDDWNAKLRKSLTPFPFSEREGGKRFSPDELIFIALSETIKDCSLPIGLLENLLKAFRQDVIRNRYDTFDEVLSYCENSANPVGRLVLLILGNRDEGLFKYSDYICTALQLTNFWQDVLVDLRKDRVYIPLEDVNKFGYSISELFKHEYNDNFRSLLQFEVGRTEELFQQGKFLVKMVKKDKLLKGFTKELKLIILGGSEILNKIRQNDYDVFNKRPVLNNLDKIKLFAKSNFV
jgi:squalene synthase HpnC